VFGWIDSCFYNLIVNFPFIGEIAKPAETVNGQDERRINAPPLTAPPVFADGQPRRESLKMASRPFLRTDKSDLLKNPNPQRGRK